MGIGDMMGIIAFSIAVIIAYPALLILLSILFSKTAAKASYRLSQGFRLPFIIGLLVAGIGGVLVVALLSTGSILQLIGAILFLILSFWGTIGIAGMAQVFGARLTELDDRQPSTLFEWLAGSVVITLSFVFPLLGWFVMIPIATVLGLGATTLSFFTRIPMPEDKPVEPTRDETLWQA